MLARVRTAILHGRKSTLPESRNYYRNTGKMANERRRLLILLSIILTMILTISLTILFADPVFNTSHAQNDENINTNPVVSIAQGKVVGKVFPCRNDNYALGFMGIPYGQAPVGNLRFRAPLPAKGWGEKTFDGTKPGPACPGIPETSLHMDEDCLHITVYTPKLPNSNEPSLLPAIVYLFGGMFIGGAVEPRLYNPSFFFGGLQKAVLVMPNFRSGPFGFLSTGDEEAPGNYGLKDIVLSLKWVQKNIRSFGGDPNRVTVVGHSSGACSAHFLTLSPLTKGLFHRIGTGSGTVAGGWLYSPRRIFVKRAYQLGMVIGCTQDTSAAIIRCLREKPYDVILRATLLTILMNPRELATWHPTDEPDIEGAFLTDSPDNLIAGGKFHDVPWVNGITRDEGLVLSGRAYANMDTARKLLPYLDEILTLAPTPYHVSLNPNAYAEALKEYYFNDLTVSTDELLDNMKQFLGDTLFTYPACLSMKHWVSQAKSPVYFYNFGFTGTYSIAYSYCACDENLGAAHADDLLYLFNATENVRDYTNKTLTDTDFQMVDAIVTMWISFATTGIPTLGPGTPQWKPYTIAEESVLYIGQQNNISFTLGENYCRDRMTFLDDLYHKLT